jgi:tetratricopeptide (TPR) repeat protein
MLPFARVSREAGAGWVAGGVFALALGLRLLCLWQLHDSGLWDYLRLDPLYYHDWAVKIAAGHAPADGTYEMTPLYAYALGFVFKVLGPSLAGPRVLQALLGAGTCAVAAWLGCRLFGRAAGGIAGVVLAAYAPSLFHETQIMKTVLTVFLSTATAAVLWVSAAARPRLLLAAGVLLGLTALAQENINVTLPLLVVWILWRAPRGARLAGAAALVAGWTVIVAPATLRNLRVAGEFVLITSGGGEVFYTGNNPHASGKYRPPSFVRPDPFFEHEDFRSEASRRLGRAVTRRESDAYWWSEGMRFIRENPGRWAALLVDKLATYFTDYERPDNYAFDNFRRFVPMLAWPLPRFGWVAPLGLVGLALSWRRWAELLPLHATMGAYLLSALLFFTQSRYRMPMVPLLALFAGHAVVEMARAARARRLWPLAWSVPAAAVLLLAVHRDPGHALGFDAQNHGILGEMNLHAGRPAPALAEFREALRLLEGYPGDTSGDQHRRVAASCHMGIVLALEMGAERDTPPATEMVEHLRAAALSPDEDLQRDALDRLGSLLLQIGDPAGAAEAWARAVQIDPGGFSRRLRLAEALHRAGRPREALVTVEAALREAPPPRREDLADAHYGQALIYMGDLRDNARAAGHLREVLRLSPAHPRAAWIRDRLASIEERP